MKFNRIIVVFSALALGVTPLIGATRWSANHIIPDADFVGSGELKIGYEGFLNTDTEGEYQFTSLVPVTLGVSEWLTTSIGWADGVTFGFKGRVLDEYKPYLPSVAIGVRDLYNNTMLARSGVENSTPEVTGELYLAFSKGFDLITTRFHGGVLSIPNSDTEEINGFFGVEKYFGNDFYLTFEGWSFADRLNLALFGTFRFLPKQRAEFYMGVIDIERLFFDQKDDFEMSFEPDFESDPVKPGISMGVNFAFSFPFGEQTQFRTVEKNYRDQQAEITYLKESVNSLKQDIDRENKRNDSLGYELAQLSLRVIDPDPIPQYYEEVFARLLLYRKGYETKPFDPESIRKVRSEIFAFEEHAENSLLRVVKKGNDNPKLEMDAVSLLGMMKSGKAVPVLLERLGSTQDRRYKIEIISALGTIGDRGAAYALEHLVNSGDESVAIAAGEVLSSWENEKINTPPEPEPAPGEEFIIE